MSIHIIPTVKVHHAWEQIKFVALQTERIDSEVQVYLNALLADMLCGKKHVLVSIDEQKQLQALLILELKMHRVTGNKLLEISHMYAWEKQTDVEWSEIFKQIKLFAEKNECAQIHAGSANPAAWKIAEGLGFDTVERHYIMRLN